MVEPIFTKEHVESLKPYIQSTTNQLLDAMIKGGCAKPVDLVEKFALPLPSYVGPLIFSPHQDMPLLTRS